MRDAIGTSNYFAETWNRAEDAELTRRQTAAKNADNATVLTTPASSGPSPKENTESQRMEQAVAHLKAATANAPGFPEENWQEQLHEIRYGTPTQLSDEQAKFMAKLRNSLAHDELPTREDVEYLIGVVEGLTRG
jgi:hypothetical protein